MSLRNCEGDWTMLPGWRGPSSSPAIIASILVTFCNLCCAPTNQDLPWNHDISTIMVSIITFLGTPSYFRRRSGTATMRSSKRR